MRIAGTVRGSENYDVSFVYDPQNEEFEEADCSCPYGAICKHIVALGLAYAESLSQHEGNVPAVNVSTDELKRMLDAIGLATNDIPENVLRTLLAYRKTPASDPPSRARNPFDPNAYGITVSPYRNYRPELHAKRSRSSDVDMDLLLTYEDLSAEQRELFTIMQRQSDVSDPWSVADLHRTFELIQASGIPLYHNSYYADSRTISVNLSPARLTAELIRDSWTRHDDPSRIANRFVLRMDKRYWKTKNEWEDTPFFATGAHLIHEVGNSLEIHTLTPDLATIIARFRPGYDRAHEQSATHHDLPLHIQAVLRWETIAGEAARCLELSTPPPDLHPRLSTETQPAFRVDFDATESTLRITPVMDYGFLERDLTEGVRASNTGGRQALTVRSTFECIEDHLVAVTDGTINCARVNVKKETHFYRELAKRAEDFGWTKMLKCARNGDRPVAKYLEMHWPRLAAYAEEHGYPIVFTEDELPRERTAFRAEFSIDLQGANDWLAFDVACYCGGENITLEELIAYIESGETFFRRQDGTLVQFDNRDELERLVETLNSFHARENQRFEAPLHHAPEIEYLITSSAHYSGEQSKSFREFIKNAQSGKPVKRIAIPRHLTNVLRPYQKKGVEWLSFLRSHRFAGILADDMGLGKTLQTLTLLTMERVADKPSIIVCPKTLLYNWKAEAEKFTPELKTLVYEGTPAERHEQRNRIGDHDLLIISYNALKQDEGFFEAEKTRFNYAVLDEAQFIKNHATKNAQIVKKLNADYRLALTGTPLENGVSELWSIFDFLMPGFLGSYERFNKRFLKPIMEENDRMTLDHLRRKISCFMLRRTKTEVAKDLPPKIEQTSLCRLGDAQNILYQQILASVRQDVFATVEKKGFKSAQIHILAGLTKLRQACNHPALLTAGKNWRKHESAKLDMCLELVEEAVGAKRKVLIFSQFTQMLDIISEAFNERGIAHLYLSGKTRDRQTLVDRFNTDDSVPVFLISLKAGGTGLNLTAADTVIIFDPWWNPGVENQAVDRAHRIGQNKTVNVYRLLTTGTIEEKIQELKEKKQQLFDALVGESGALFQKLTWDDVRKLFST